MTAPKYNQARIAALLTTLRRPAPFDNTPRNRRERRLAAKALRRQSKKPIDAGAA